MSENDGTFSKLMEIAEATPSASRPPTPPRRAQPSQPQASPVPAAEPSEDLSTTPYISQNYRFTEDELRWLRRQSLNLSERLGSKVSQNTILRVALQVLRELYTKSPKSNPLLETLNKLKK